MISKVTIRDFVNASDFCYVDIQEKKKKIICMSKLQPENAFSICQMLNMLDYRSILRGQVSYTQIQLGEYEKSGFFQGPIQTRHKAKQEDEQEDKEPLFTQKELMDNVEQFNEIKSFVNEQTALLK